MSIKNKKFEVEQEHENEWDSFLDGMSKTNYELEKLVDFEKINKNLEESENDLIALNKLIKSSEGVKIDEKELSKRIDELFEINPSCFYKLANLVSIRDINKFKVLLNNKDESIYSILSDKEKVKFFLTTTGLEKMIVDKKIVNFLDLFIGIEIGMDTNARKNRNGKKFEQFLTNKITCLVNEKLNDKQRNEIIYKFQIRDSDVDENEEKIYDCVIINKINGKTIYLESSFYNSGGSKPSETARSYETVNKKIRTKKNKFFFWVVGGDGMLTIKNELYRLWKQGFVINEKQLENIFELTNFFD